MNKIKFCENGAFRQIAYNNVIHYDIDKDLFDKFKNIYKENKALKHQLELSEQKRLKAEAKIWTIVDYINSNGISTMDILEIINKVGEPNENN